MRKLLSCDEEERVKEVDELGEEVPGECDCDHHHGNEKVFGVGVASFLSALVVVVVVVNVVKNVSVA